MDRAIIGKLARRILKNIPLLFDYYVKTVRFATSPMSMLFSKPSVAHRLINLFEKLETWEGV